MLRAEVSVLAKGSHSHRQRRGGRGVDVGILGKKEAAARQRSEPRTLGSMLWSGGRALDSW